MKERRGGKERMTQASSLTNNSKHISKNRKKQGRSCKKNVVVFEICAMGKGVKGRPVCVRSCLGPVVGELLLQVFTHLRTHSQFIAVLFLLFSGILLHEPQDFGEYGLREVLGPHEIQVLILFFSV